MQIRLSNNTELSFWLKLFSLFVAAVAMRWVRLDLIAFRFDQAEVAIRCEEAWQKQFPFTGIYNSLGFRNAGGYIWTLLPATLVSGDVKTLTAWHGLLTATIVIPLALLGQRLRKDILAWVPAVLGAFLPLSVFAGRSIWAQNLLPVFSAWALFALYFAIDEGIDFKKRRNFSVLAVLLMAWATSIHFSAAILLGLVAGVIAAVFWRRKRSLFFPAAVGVIIFLTVVPSLVSYLETKSNPKTQPEYVLKFMSMMPPALPWWERIREGLESELSLTSWDAVPEISAVLFRWAWAVSGYDTFISLVCVAGCLSIIIKTLSRRSDSRIAAHQFSSIILLWIALPVVLAGLLLPRSNAGYFYCAAPAVYLTPMFLPLSHAWDRAKTLTLVLIGCGSIWICVLFLTAINSVSTVPGPYYIPLRYQEEVIRIIAQYGVKPGRLKHLSGDYFQRSYEYLHSTYAREVELQPTNEPFVLIEDMGLRMGLDRRALVYNAKPATVGSVAVLLFENKGQAEIWSRQYYALPPD